jgi:hypothetical protein
MADSVVCTAQRYRLAVTADKGANVAGAALRVRGVITITAGVDGCVVTPAGIVGPGMTKPDSEELSRQWCLAVLFALRGS